MTTARRISTRVAKAKKHVYLVCDEETPGTQFAKINGTLHKAPAHKPIQSTIHTHSQARVMAVTIKDMDTSMGIETDGHAE
jgi:hypothetical protein